MGGIGSCRLQRCVAVLQSTKTPEVRIIQFGVPIVVSIHDAPRGKRARSFGQSQESNSFSPVTVLYLVGTKGH
jgi:hypothetical protein